MRFLSLFLVLILLAACAANQSGEGSTASRQPKGNSRNESRGFDDQAVYQDTRNELTLLAEACTGQIESLRELVDEAISVSQELQSKDPDAFSREQERQQGLQTILRQLSLLETDLRTVRIELRPSKEDPESGYKVLLRSLLAIANDLRTLSAELTELDSGGEAITQQRTDLALRKQYEQALAAYDAGSYENSILLFEEFLNKHAGSDLAANAHYWIGENYYSAELYPKALREFQTVVANYPGHKKAADAQLKIGLSHFQLNDTQAAQRELLLLKKLYPDYPNMQMVDKYLSRMQP